MNRVGNPYDNAKAESFMKTLKAEEVDGRAYADLEEARRGLPTRWQPFEAIASYVTHSGCCSVSTAEKSLCPKPAVHPPSTTNSEPVE